jgi:hypothetical protein
MRLLYDTSEEVLARGRREREHLLSLGRHRRCDTNIVNPDNGDCTLCGAANGQECQSRVAGTARKFADVSLTP